MPVGIPANTAMARNRGTRRGYTLLEMLIVVTITGLVATLVMPSLSSNDVAKLDAAASEVVDAVRFARSEAIRAGEQYGVDANVAAQRVRVYRLDVSGGLPVLRYDVYHPVTKKLYDLQFDNNREFSGVRIEKSEFWFEGFFGARDLLGFNVNGVPKYNDGGTIRMLVDGRIQLSLGEHERDIEVAPMTGRVTVK